MQRRFSPHRNVIINPGFADDLTNDVVSLLRLWDTTLKCSHDFSGKDTYIFVDRCSYAYPISLRYAYSWFCVTVSELFVKKLWYRSTAKIKNLFYEGTTETSTAYWSPIPSFRRNL